mgnify:CR=1 FL=1
MSRNLRLEPRQRIYLKFSHDTLNLSTKEKKLNFASYFIELLGELFLNPTKNVSESSGFEKFFRGSHKKVSILDT